MTPHPLFTRRPEAPHTNYRCTSCGELVAVCEPVPCVNPLEFRCLGCMEAAADARILSGCAVDAAGTAPIRSPERGFDRC